VDEPEAAMSFRDTDPMWRLNNEPRYPLPSPVPAGRPSRYVPCNTIHGLGSSSKQQLRSFQATVEVLPLDGHLRSGSGIAHEIEHLGLFVHSRTTLPLGTLVRLRLDCELGQASFTAKVVQSVERYGIGCAFVDLDDCDRAILSLIVAAANSAPDHARTIGLGDNLPTLRTPTLH
jgi:hypothetical protein